jgi:putative endonuclease
MTNNIGFVIARSEATRQSRVVKRDFQPAVYILANKRNGTLYTGVTSDLRQRVWQHREGVTGGFTQRHGCKLLVWYELHATMEYAITREKQIKAGSRKKKTALIETTNPQWRDLFADICA